MHTKPYVHLLFWEVERKWSTQSLSNLSLRSAERNSDFRKFFIYSNHNVPTYAREPGGLIFFQNCPWVPRIGWGGLFERGLHKELEYKVQKLNKKKLEVIQPKIEKFPVGEETIPDQSKRSFTVVIN